MAPRNHASPGVPRTAEARGRSSGSRVRLVVVGSAAVLALLPAVRMVGIVLDGSVLQYNDYWLMLDRFVDSGGGLDISGLLAFNNDHPVVIPQFVYWLNIVVFSGSNVSLGLIVVGVVLGQLAVLGSLLWRSPLSLTEKLALLVLASALLFDRTGTWNFAKAMSGTAWLSANLFAIIAVYLRASGRRWGAFAAATSSSVSYATGLVAWPAVAVVGISAGPARRWRHWIREWPSAVGFVATSSWYAAARDPGGSTATWNPVDVLRAAAGLLGSVLGLSGGFAQGVGAVALIGVPVLVLRQLWFRESAAEAGSMAAAGFCGIAAFGWLSTVEIAYGRNDFVLLGDFSRYSSLAALTWLGFVGLAVISLREDVSSSVSRVAPRARVGPIPPRVSVTLIALIWVPVVSAGGPVADTMLEARSDQRLNEIALQLGVTDGSTYLLGGFSQHTTEVDDLASDLGHYPFVDGWDLDCGLLDRSVGAPEAGATERVGGELTSGEITWTLPDAVQLTGRVRSESPIRCVLVTNGEGRVVGAGTTTEDDESSAGSDAAQDARFRAIARKGSQVYRALIVVEGRATPVPLEGAMSRDDLGP